MIQKDMSSLLKCADEYFSREEYLNALKLYVEFQSQNPQEFISTFRIGLIKYGMESYHEAADFLLNAYKINPQNKDNLVLLIQCLQKLSLNEEAAKFADHLKFIDKDSGTSKIEKTIKDTDAINQWKKLEILFIQDTPCIRNYKYATALKKRGHTVTLAYFNKKLSEQYPGLKDDVYSSVVRINNLNQLWNLAPDYDIIHSHNEPDSYTVAALASNIPVIHDTHDLISLREPGNDQLKYFEGIANRASAGRIYSTPYQKQEVEKLYNVHGPSLIFYNYASEDQLPKRLLSKLSSHDGKIHFVYQGGIFQNGHRDFNEDFVKLSSFGHCVHIFPVKYSEAQAEFFHQYPNIKYYHPVSPTELIETMTQFDFGIIPWNIEKGNVRFLSSTLANKLFEYLAAGLPVAASEITSYRDFFAINKVGVTFKSIDDLISKLPELKSIRENSKGALPVFTYEKEVSRLEEFYYEVISKKEDKFQPKASREIKIADSYNKLLHWIDQNGWEGYDPYDIEDLLINAKFEGVGLSDEEIQKIRAFNEVDPLECRKHMQVSKKINAKAMGLLLSSYCKYYSIINDEDYLNKAVKISDWLLSNNSKEYKNLCWGYPFEWQSIVLIPKGTPSVVVSCVVGDGFWQLYKTTLNKKYLDVCVSICNFILEDLNCYNPETGKLCFSYTPIDDFHVHNANLFAAEFLVRLGKEIDDLRFIEAGISGANYTIGEQNEDGSIFYWAKIQDKYNSRHLDSYHSGFEIRCLFSLYCLTGDIGIKSAFEKYLNYYVNNYIDSEGKTLQFPIYKKNDQVNIHGIAESILMFSLLSPEYPDLLEKAERCICWALSNLQHNDGWFGYIIRNNKAIMVPFFRWGEAWMLRAMTEFFFAQKIEKKEFGFFNQYTETPGQKASLSINRDETFVQEAKSIHKNTTYDKNSSGFMEYQFSLPNVPDFKYGTREWTEYLYRNSLKDPWGQDWRASQIIRYLKSIELIKNNVAPENLRSVLDVGCATGHFINLLKNHFSTEYTGVDSSEACIIRCKSDNINVNFIRSSLPELMELHNLKYDLISALEVICYVTEDKLDSALLRFKELLNPNGYLLVSIYMNQPPFYTPDNFRSFISKHFNIVQELTRFHKPYYKIETPLRETMEMIRNQLGSLSPQSSEIAKDFLKSSFYLLNNIEYLEFCNHIARDSGNIDAISHSIILAKVK